VIGDNKDLGAVVVSTQDNPTTTAKENTGSVTITTATPAVADINTANFVDHDALGFEADSSPSKASFSGKTVTGKASTWETDKHVPLVMGIRAVDTGLLKTGTIPLRIVVDGAPSASAGSGPVTTIEDTGAAQAASFNWWQFFEDKEGGIGPTKTWADLATPFDSRYAAGAASGPLGGTILPAEAGATGEPSERYSLRAWSSDPEIATVGGNQANSVSAELLASAAVLGDGSDVDGVLRFVGHAVGEAMITVVLTEPSMEVYSEANGNDAANPVQDNAVNLVHAGKAQHAVKRFMVKVVEKDTSRSP
jgi:hypothetical protein